MSHIDLFSGIGGFALAAQWNGFETILFCDNDKFCQKVLERRFNGAPIIADIRNLDGTKYRGATLLTGGFPCQPFSQAGKRKGKEDDRYLWDEMFRVIREAQPKWVLAENVYGLLTIENGLVFNKVLSDLESVGYEVQPLIIPACAVNAPHRRDRVWIIAHTNGGRGGRETGIGENDTRGVQSTKQNYNANKANRERIVAYNKCLGWQERTRQGIQSKKQITEGQEFNNIDNEKSSVITNSFSTRGSRRRSSNEVDRCNRGEEISKGQEWDENWVEVATEFCGVFNGVSDWLDRHFNRIIMEGNYGKSIKGNKGKDLSCLRETLQQKEVWEKIRGFFTVFEQTDLLTILWKLQEATEGQDDIQFKGEESVEINGLRELWDNAQFRCSPHRRQYQKQLAGELKNIVPQLPHEIALEVAEIWDCLQCAYASMISPETHINDWVVSKSRHRVERLKSLGNAIVPQVAYQIIRAIVEVENDQT